MYSELFVFGEDRLCGGCPTNSPGREDSTISEVVNNTRLRKHLPSSPQKPATNFTDKVSHFSLDTPYASGTFCLQLDIT